MSGTLILKNGAMAVMCVAGLSLTACASSSNGYGHNSGSRYGSVYDYESGGNCNAGPCGAVVAAPAVASRYGSSTVIGGQAVSPGVVYADCSVVGGMNCNAQSVQSVPVYTQPAAPVYAQATPSYGSPVACPAGTTPNGDGTCMEASSMPYGGSPPSMRQTQAYSSPPSMSQSYSGEMAACPSGTTPNGDGTCMESGSGYDYSSSTTTGSTHSYGGTTSTQSYSGEMADCPAGTTPNGDGTCMEGTGGTVEIYGNGGYQQSPTYTAPVDYRPFRK